MLTRHSKNKSTFSPDLTTCSDIIFTLLIFYILTQNFVTRFAVELPQITSKEQSAAQKTQRIEIAENGDVSLNDTILSEGWKTEICQRVEKLATDTHFMLIAHKRAPAGTVVEMIDQLSLLGVKHVSFAGITEPSADTESPK